MYLRTIYELEEEGIVPMRARIAERLGQSGPTVSQTVARMERDGLLTVAEDRRLRLSTTGRRQATAVMRKHRLAECLLVQIIGLDWEDVHVEACRWEHVMSEAVERRLVNLLGGPTQCPHGNPIPGLADLGFGVIPDEQPARLVTLAEAAGAEETEVVVRRISEQLQPDTAVLRALKDAGVQPGRRIRVVSVGDHVVVGGEDHRRALDGHVAAHVYVSGDHLR
ncbi:MAG: metal-dependent transcriptional regulator [Actinobacteria bacterium]|nr:metal-dependent transcriptional regulator [Actinomycetota bacterium]